MTTRGTLRRWKCTLCAVALLALPACQQKMAQQPYYRPLEQTNFFADGRSSRPLEAGVVHVAQFSDDDPRLTGLSAEGRTRPAPKDPGPGAEPLPLAGAPSNPANFVSAFPFAIKDADLRRGMERYTIYCVECHGPLGNGGGKIVERGFLRPPSFHTTKLPQEPNEPDESAGPELNGHSRGFFRFGQRIPLREVPVGYIFEVITRGYGGMPAYDYMIPPADRWYIAAYVRTLQFSQHAAANDLTPDDRAALEGAKK